MTESLTRIQERQREWASQHKGLTGFADYHDNLFEPLKPDAKCEYASGDGHELESHMHSLISSSALCCNFFHHWRYNNPNKLCQALHIQGSFLKFNFEAKPQKPAGIPGKNPNVDVLIASGDHELTAIECKFTEPYQTRSQAVYASKPLAASYFGEYISVWQTMPRCRELAKLLPHIAEDDVALRYLAADQLIKHAVGLLNTYPWKNWRLVYLWYDDGSDIAQDHRDEIERFIKAIGDDFSFESITYQDLLSRLCEDVNIGKSEWANYMRWRYFPDR